MSGAGEVRVAGGVGGVRARYDDVRLLGELWSGTGDTLSGHAWTDKAEAADGDLLLSGALSPATFAEVEQSVLRATWGPGGLVHRAAEVSAVSVAARGMVALYEGADAAAQRTADLVAYAVGRHVLPGVAALSVAALVVLPGSLPVALGALRQVPGLATRHPGALQFLVRSSGGLLDAVNRLPVGAVVAGASGLDPWHPDVASAAGDLGPHLFEDRGGTAVPHPHGPQHAAPQDLAGLVQALADAAAADVDGQFTVQQVVGPDGQTVWIVQLPGTDGFTDPDDVRNMGTNLELIAGSHTAYADAVAQALAHAGVDPDDPVMLVGHSQGGMQAVALAGDEDFGYHVTHVVTAGSPVAGMSPAEGVQVLSLENTGDVVPGLDGHDNPAGSQHTTVTGTVDHGSIPDNHDIGGVYVPLAGAAEAAGSPSVQEFVTSAVATGHLAGGTTTTTTYVAQYEGK